MTSPSTHVLDAALGVPPPVPRSTAVLGIDPAVAAADMSCPDDHHFPVDPTPPPAWATVPGSC